MKNINGRYQLRSQLNSSEYHDTYLAEDLESGAILEFVLLKPGLSSSNIMETIIDKASFYLENHPPGLTCLHDLDIVRQIDGSSRYQIQYFYTRDIYIGAETIPYGQMTRPQAVGVIVELIRLVKRLHQQGLSVGILNFENIQIALQDGQPHIQMLDLVSLDLRKNLFFEQDEVLVQFKAPEIIYDNAESQFSDYYSLAKIIFYLFFNVDYREVSFKAELHRYGSSPLTDRLGQMASMLGSEREAAFQAVMILFLEMWDEVVQEPTLARAYLQLDAYYYDKADQLRRLRQAVALRYNYESQVKGFLIVGAAGSGKSRLMRELRLQLQLRRIQPVWIGGDADDHPISLVSQIVSQMDLDINPEQVSSQLQHAGESEQLRISNRMMNRILDRIRYRPIVVMIDGITRLPRYEIKMLNYYLNTNQTSPMTFVLSATQEEIEANFQIREGDNRVMTVSLSDFDYHETLEFFKNQLGMGEQADRLVGELMEETSGNPGGLTRRIRALIDENVLYLNNELDWFFMDKDKPLSLSGGVETSDILARIDACDENTRSVLQLMSIFDFPVDIFYVAQILSLSQKEASGILTDLVAEHLIEERIGDGGYAYEYTDRLMRMVVRSHIPSWQYIRFNELAAEQIKQNVSLTNYQMNQYLIYHYRESHQYDQAITLCERVAADMGRAHMVSQQIKYYELAIDINTKRGKPFENVEIYSKLAEIQLQRGSIGLAREMIDRAVQIAESQNDHTAYYGAMFIKLLLMMRQSQIDKTEETLERIEAELSDETKPENRFRFAYIRSKVLYSKNRLQEMHRHASEQLQKATKADNREFMAFFSNELGIALTHTGHPDEAIEAYEDSYRWFIEIGNHMEASRPLNNIGVVYIDAYGNLTKAREYFLKGLHTVENVQESFERIIYLNNVAETYFIEGRFKDALTHLKRAENLVRLSQHSNFGFNVYLTLFSVNCALNRYETAFGYFNKLEYEISLSKDRGIELRDYYYTVIEYLICQFDYLEAENYLLTLTRLMGDEGEQPPIRREILHYKILMFKTQVSSRNQIGSIQLIQRLAARAANLKEVMVLRQFILDTVDQMFYSNRMTEVQYLMDLDAQLAGRFDNETLRLHRRLMKGVFEADRITYFRGLMGEVFLPEDQWKLMLRLGKECFFAGRYREAADHLVEAFEGVRKLMKLVPVEYRDHYLFYDPAKIELRNFIISTMAKVLGSHVLEDEKIFHAYSIESVDTFFTLRNYHLLVEPGHRESWDGIPRFNSVSDLIGAFGYNVYDNILMILQYLKEFSNAQYASIFIFDSDNRIMETLGDAGSSQGDVQRILKNFYGSQGILINEFLKIGNSNYLPDKQSALILIPLQSEQVTRFNRRSSSQTAYNSYLYLTADRPFNNFTQKAFEEILQLNRFIYEYVEKYYLNSFFSVDKTTGVFMRSHVEECVHQEIYYSKMTDRKFVIVMGDIDKFKEINDSFGHKKGDDVLQTLGQIMKETLRETDIVGRYGGEEFILFLPNTDLDMAFEVVERVRRQIAGHQFTGLNRTVTMSFGLSGYPDHSEALEDLIEKADQALYLSKATGRNRVTMWNPGSMSDRRHLSHLDGILTGNEIVNLRSIKGILELIELHRHADDEEKRSLALRAVMEITGARYGTYMYADQRCLSLEASDWNVQEICLFDSNLIESHPSREEGDYFVDWRNFSEINPETGRMSWLSLIIMPVQISGVYAGTLLLGAPVYEKEFDYGDFNLVNRIAPLIGSLL